MKKVRLFAALVLPLVIGMISAAISLQGMAAYGSMNKPPLSPPAWVFSVAWTILYLMMGVASCYILSSAADRQSKAMALLLYLIQLVMNFFWSIIFFNWKMYFVALIWLIFMFCIVILCARRFFRISKIAGYLLLPYILWLIFAAYLNLGVAILA